VNTYICDIDGTIADNQHRQWILTEPGKPQPNWELFFNLMGEDSPVPHMQKLLWDLHRAKAKIVYVTGRPEPYRQLTHRWLIKHNFPIGEMYMRPKGDHRPDHIVKKELYDAYLVNERKPIMIFDDRNTVVKMWREMGLPCAQVVEGDF
jgi:hypothetical protein